MFTMETAGRECFPLVFSLMKQAFPPTERRTEDGQRALLDRSGYSYRILREENGSFLGFLAVWDLGEFRFVEHFAVNEAARGKGIGGKALQMWMEEKSTPVVLEVEPPETELARRRIGFYQRVGLFLNDFPYTQPSMQQGQPPIPLKIMSWPGKILEEEFRPWQQCLYDRVYLGKPASKQER